MKREIVFVLAVFLLVGVFLWSCKRISASYLSESHNIRWFAATLSSGAVIFTEPSTQASSSSPVTTITTNQVDTSLSELDGNNNDKPPAIKILCWVMTVDSESNRIKSDAVEATWGRRCDRLLLVRNGSELAEHDGILTVPLDHEGRDQLWHKVVAAFTYLHSNYLTQYDWFMKADDDTYVLVESLKRFLKARGSPEESVYFGYKFKPFVEQGYMSGGKYWQLILASVGAIS